jgi:LacI family transcriptional regulator
LRTKRTATIGYVIDEAVRDPFAGAAIAGAHDFARRHRSLLLVVHTNRDARIRRAAIEDLLDRQVDAILFAVVGTHRVTLPETVLKVPVALVDCYTTQGGRFAGLPTVLPDEQAAGHSAARLLLDAGHHDIAFLAGLPGSWATRARLRGIRAALTEAGHDPRRLRLRHGTFRADSGHELTRTILADGPRPTALVCGNDRMAFGAYLALGEAGLRIPRDMSVVGFDDHHELAADIRPALTTIRLPYYEMGSWAVEHVLPSSRPPTETTVHLPCPVVVRDSVAAPRS